jgi:MFS family permease
MQTPSRTTQQFASLQVPEIRLLIGSVGFFTLAGKALAVIIGFQIYQITHSVLALGWLGLVEAIPAISLAPFGGYVADRFNRRTILLVTRVTSVACTLVLALLSWNAQETSVWGLYAVIFVVGLARGFADPAGTAFEAQVVPQPLAVNASSWLSSTWITCAVIGPAAIGFIFDAWGAAHSYLLITFLFFLSWVCTRYIAPKPQAVKRPAEPLWESILQGWRFLFKTQPLVAGMALDLFGVFFGGAIALLPVYANDILNVGAKGLGILNAAPALGALLVMLAATRYAPMERAGRNLLLTVMGFGVSMVVFAFSRDFLLSLAALFFSGVFDGVSVVIRRAMLRLLSPEAMRGRIASASSIFICASNELGGFESGMLAALIGTVPCVAVGGIATLGVVALVAKLAPELRTLRFDAATMERKH